MKTTRNCSLQLYKKKKFQTFDNSPNTCRVSLPSIINKGNQTNAHKKTPTSTNVQIHTHNNSNITQHALWLLHQKVTINQSRKVLASKLKYHQKKTNIISILSTFASDFVDSCFPIYFWISISTCEILCCFADYEKCIEGLSIIVYSLLREAMCASMEIIRKFFMYTNGMDIASRDL